MNFNKILTNTLCLIYILAASFQILSASQPKFNFRDNGLDVSIDAIDINIIQSPFDSSKETISYEGLQGYTAISLDKDNPEHLLRFVIAVPDLNKATIAEFGFAESTVNNSRIIQFLTTGARPSAIIKPIGRRRGIQTVAVEINPFGYNPESQQYFVAENIQLRIDFNQPVPSVSYPLSRHERTFFEDVVNKTQLGRLHSAAVRVIQGDSPASFEGQYWYSPDVKYIKIATSKDAITKIGFSEVLNIAPELSGRQSQYLHLLFEGEEMPFAILNDNGIIDINDEAIFWGQVAKGDTTWFNTYSSSAVYYLYYDDTIPGRRLNKLPAIASNKAELQSVRISRHIEVDKVYDHGMFPTSSETTPMEGFYWQRVVPGDAGKMGPMNRFDYDFFADPGPGDILKMAVYMNLQNTAYYIPEYHLDIQVNGVIKDSKKFQGVTYNSVKADLKEIDIFSGRNNLVVNSYKTGETEISIAGIEYVAMEGNVRPSAFGGELDFFVDNQANDSYVKAFGFSDDVYVVDLVNDYYLVPELNPGTTVRAGCSSPGEAFSVIMINDSSFAFAEAGIHFVVLSGESYSDYRTGSFTDYGDAEDFLDDLQAGDILIASNNLEAQFPESLRIIFRSYGSKIADLLQPGEAFVFAAKIGNTKAAVFEGRTKSGNANLSGFIGHSGGRSFSFELDIEKSKAYHFVINDLQAVRPAVVSSQKSSDLRNTANQADAIYISYRDFVDAARILADFRSERQGLNVTVVDVENIYKEFYNGIESPHAIKEFLRYTLNSWQQPGPVYIGIFGDASWDSRKVMDVSISDTYVPAYGVPVSDYWYALMDNSVNSMPEMKVGRISAKTSKQAMDYVEKAIEYDQLPVRPWMKRFLYLTGGNTDSQRDNFFDYNFNYSEHVMNKSFCGDTTSVRKLDDAASGESEAGDIRAKINQGALWTNFLGHASSGLFDMDGWRVSRLNNNKRYGILSTLSCNTSDFGTPEKLSSRNETYILEPDVGYVATLGSSGTGNVLVDVILFLKMLESITQPDIGYRNISDILQFAKDLIFRDRPSGYRDEALHQFTLLGDPLLNIRVNNRTDLFINEQEIALTNEYGSNIITESDTLVTISGAIYNNGFNSDSTGDILLIRSYSGAIDSAWYQYSDFCFSEHFSFNIDIADLPGEHKLSVIVDPNNKIDDADRSNNIYSTSLIVLKRGLQPLDPLAYWNVSPKPEFRVVNPLSSTAEFKYEFMLTENIDTLSTLIAKSEESEIETNESYIEWTPGITLTAGKGYWLQARLVNITSGGLISKWLQIPFYVSNDYIDEEVEWKQTTEEHLSDNKYENLILSGGSNPEIHLKSKDLIAKIVSVNGSFYTIPNDHPDFRQRWLRMEINDAVYFDDYGFRGFNLVVISRRADSVPVRTRSYDTWNDTSSSTELVRFLRDSVGDDDYVLIGTCDQSFRVPYHLTPPDSIGYIDTLRAVLREFGSAEASKLDSSWSFAMIGYRGAAPGSVPEMAALWDTAAVNGTITRSAMSGRLISTVAGPAKSWKNLSIDAQGIDEFSSMSEQIKGIDAASGNIDDLLEVFGQSEVDLSFIDATKYPFLFAEAIISRDSPDSDPYYAGGFNFDFEPAPELAILTSETGIGKDGQLRGYFASVHTTIRNISKRTKSQQSDVVYEIVLDGNVIFDTVAIPPIGHD